MNTRNTQIISDLFYTIRRIGQMRANQVVNLPAKLGGLQGRLNITHFGLFNGLAA